MNIKSICLGPISANCYAFCDEKGEGAVVDPGDYNVQLEKVIEECGIKTLKYIICTHSHFDHVSGVGRLKEKHPDAQVVVGKEDAPALSDAVLSASADFGLVFYPCYADKTVVDNDVLIIGNILLKVVATPGHTKGSIVLHCEEEKIAFTGDTIFKESAGRTDFYGGSHVALMASLQKIKRFASDTILLCGHGENTTVENEIKYNPYVL